MLARRSDKGEETGNWKILIKKWQGLIKTAWRGIYFDFPLQAYNTYSVLEIDSDGTRKNLVSSWWEPNHPHQQQQQQQQQQKDYKTDV